MIFLTKSNLSINGGKKAFNNPANLSGFSIEYLLLQNELLKFW